MRIAMIAAAPTSGHDQLAPLAGALAQRGHRVHVYSMPRDGRLPAQLHISGGVMFEQVPAGRSPSGRLLSQLGAFGRRLAARWAAQHRLPDVVHVEAWPGCVAALAATHRPIVMTYRPARAGAPEYAVSHAADRVIARSAEEVSDLTGYGVEPSRIRVLDGGVDTLRFHPGGTGRSGRQRRILAVGGLADRDGVADLIRTLPQLPEAELTVVGGPAAAALGGDPTARRLRGLAAALGVGERVRLLGSVPQARMPELYHATGVVACTGRAGPAFVVPLEAMACGVPVVGYQESIGEGIVADGWTGAVVAFGDGKGLTRALGDVLRDGVRRARLGGTARQVAEDRHSWGAVAERVEQIYGEAIEEACMPPAMRVSTLDEAGVRG